MYAPRSGFKPSHSFNRKVARQRRSDSDSDPKGVKAEPE
jgi:hypothetical protein